MKTTLGLAMAMAVGLGVPGADAQDSLAARISAHRADARALAGTDFDGTLATLCVAPDAPVGARGPRPIPERASWYAEPGRAFDNLYWVGTKVHSSWALKTSAGIILIDTLYNYAAETEIIGGLKKLGLDPASIKYVIISHGHGDHDEGAKLLQDRFGAHVVMSAADWDLEARTANKPGGVPKRDVVASDGQKITLGDTTVTLIATPGHTPGTLSMIFQVKDHGKPLTVAYSGGTAFNFAHTPANYDTYIASQRKMAKAAGDAEATVVLSNHSQFDKAYDRVRIAQARRTPGEANPFEVGADAAVRYFKMSEACAQAGRLEAGGG